jgi:hypothetical protein
MRLLPILVLFGVVACAVYILWFVWYLLFGTNTHKRLQQAVNEEKQKRDNIWKEATAIEEMVNLYMSMVAKHGPDSVEAKAFRFGTDSPTMKGLHSDTAALQAFEHQCNIIDTAYRKINQKKGNNND